MKFRIRMRTGDDVRAVWLLVALLAAGGTYVFQTRYQAAIARAHERTEKLYAQVTADVRIVRQARRFRQVQRRAEQDLSHLSYGRSFSAATVEFLSSLERSGKAFSTRVLAVEPAAAAHEAGANSGPGKPAPPLDAIAVTIRVRGRFARVLRFVEDLSHHATPVRVWDTEITLAGERAFSKGQPEVDATIHATIYRVDVPLGGGDRRASA